MGIAVAVGAGGAIGEVGDANATVTTVVGIAEAIGTAVGAIGSIVAAGAEAVGAATVGTGEGGSAAIVGITASTIAGAAVGATVGISAGADAGTTVGAEVAAMVGKVPAVGLRCAGAVLVVLVATAADAPHAASIPTSTNAIMNRAKDCNTAQFLSIRQ